MPGSSPSQQLSRRRFLKSTLGGAAGFAFYAGEVERHWIDMTQQDVAIRRLPASFDGMTVVQLSDIHLDEFTEPFLLRDAVDRINRLQPDLVLLTGDYVSYQLLSKQRTVGAAWQCAGLLKQLTCTRKYAILGNHDVMVGEHEVSEALTGNGIPVLRNSCLPIERGGSRIWLAGVDDPVCGRPDLDLAIPAAIRNIAAEPVVLMSHAPDYVDNLRAHPAGNSVAFMLSGHTHGGQVRVPLIGALRLPPGGRKYVEGLFRVGNVQLYVNRGLGTVGLPLRFDCPPEITSFTLRSA